MSENWKNKLLRARPEIIALGLLIPLAVILGAVLTRPSLPPKELRQISLPSPTPSLVTTQTASPVLQKISLDILVAGKTTHYDIAVTGEVFVADVLLQAQQRGLQLQTKNFGGSLGLFVEAINGVKNDEAKQMYWTLYVNGARSSLGASSARIKLGDVVTWKFEKIHEE